MSSTFTVELDGKPVQCRLPLFRHQLQATSAWSAANGRRNEEGEWEREPDHATLGSVISAIGAICLPASTGRPSPPRSLFGAEAWAQYGSDVDQWLWTKRRRWMSDDAWTKACGVCLDQMLDTVLPAMADEEAEEAAAPFGGNTGDSSEG